MLTKTNDFPKIIDEVAGIFCYDHADIVKWAKKHGILKKWRKWYTGQTGAIQNGKFLVYEHDFLGFLEGKPVLD
jgi:hypothetical protein